MTITSSCPVRSGSVHFEFEVGFVSLKYDKYVLYISGETPHKRSLSLGSSALYCSLASCTQQCLCIYVVQQLCLPIISEPNFSATSVMVVVRGLDSVSNIRITSQVLV